MNNFCFNRIFASEGALRICFAAVLTASASIRLYAGYPDGVVCDFDFERGDLNSNQIADPGEIADLAHWSVDSEQPGSVFVERTNADGWETVLGLEGKAPLPVSFKMCDVVPAMLGGTVTNTRSCLYLPQEFQSDGTVTQYLDRCVLLSEGADRIIRTNTTVYLRFKWMGGNSHSPKERILFSGWWDKSAGKGFAVSIMEKKNLDRADVFLFVHGTRYPLGNLDIGNAKDEYGRLLNAGWGSSMQIYRDHWYDMVLSLCSDGETTRGDVTLANVGFPKTSSDEHQGSVPQIVRYFMSAKIPLSFADLNDESEDGRSGRRMVLGAAPEAVESGNSWQTVTENSVVSGFEGYIDRCVIWNRALNADEAVAVMTGNTGDALKLGYGNGSAFEFAADGDPDIASGVFDPRTMPTRRLRRDLTAQNPSVSIAVALPPEEEGVNKILNLRTVLSDGISSAELAVFVNDKKVSEFVSRGTESSLGIAGRFMKRNQDGTVLLEIRRTGNVAGTISLDCLSVNGSWRAGTDDGSYAEFADPAVFPRYFTVGSDPSLVRNSQSGIGQSWGASYYFPGLDFLFTVPQSCKELGWTYRYKVIGWQNMAASEQTFVYYLNGTEIGRDEGFVLPQTKSIALPADVLIAGLNRLSISNAAVKVGGNGCPPRLFFDWHVVDVDLPPSSGLFIVVR